MNQWSIFSCRLKVLVFHEFTPADMAEKRAERAAIMTEISCEPIVISPTVMSKRPLFRRNNQL